MGELLIAAGPGEWRAAWVEDGAAVEIYVERGDTKPPASRHLGRVVRVVTALDAALVDIGDERPGFLPLRGLPATFKTEEGARIVVEVRREAWAEKAPRLIAIPPDAAEIAGREPPAQLFPSPGLAPALSLRLPAAPARVVTDDAAVLGELRRGFPGAAIAHAPARDWPIDLDATFDAALAPSLALVPEGAVHFDEARAATLIDVDSGTPARGASARAALTANRAAARLIARELRLRNIGGAVAIDFVGLERRDHRDQVQRALEAALAADPAAAQVLGWTRLGHLELTRRRRGRSLADAMLAPGERRKSPVALAHEALSAVLRAARANPAASWRLSVPRPVEAALRGPAAAALAAFETQLGRRLAITVEPRSEGFDIAPI